MPLLNTIEGIVAPQTNPNERIKAYVLVEMAVSLSGSTAWIAGSCVVSGSPISIAAMIW